MRTFKELADAALGQEPTHMVVKELAQAMDRLEYNLAFQLAHMNLRGVPPISEEMREILVGGWVNNLRADLP